MYFTKISGATAVLLISMISASPIQFSEFSTLTESHPHPTGSLAPMISATNKPHPTAMEPHPTGLSAHIPESSAFPSGGFKNAPHHSFPSGPGSSVEVETATAALPTATATAAATSATGDEEESASETAEILPRATKDPKGPLNPSPTKSVRSSDDE